jgi:uncharacterized protein (DUF1697 family)
VALLRGINVGGKNLIRMADLQACFVEEGFDDVRTYIQSGNVVFGTGRASAADLTDRIERMLASAFDYEASVVLRSAGQMRRVIERAPTGFGEDPSHYRYDVLFLKPPLTPGRAIREVPTKDGVDVASVGPGVIYYARLEARVTSSRISRIVAMPMYQDMTIRNWNTTVKLRALVDEARR